MKKCPYCAEEIQDDAVKCRFCHERLDKPMVKWFFATSTIVIAFLTVGPLMLPLIWFHPRYKLITKVIWTVVIIGVTVLSVLALRSILDNLRQQLDALQINLYN